MELLHFRCFAVIAEELHFTRAAERLHLSQPHLTRIINQIEKELGVLLLQRTTRQVILTDAGEKFYAEAQAVLKRVEQAVCVMQQFHYHETSRLRLGFTEMARHCVVPRILPIFCSKYPKVELDIVENCTEELVESLDAAKVDIAFLHPPLRADFLDVIPIHQERFMIALSVEHKFAHKLEIDLANLSGDTFILHYREHGPVLYDSIINLCKRAGFTPKVIHQSTDRSFLGFVTAKVGVCFITPSMQNARNPGVVCLPIAGEAPTLEHAVVWRKDSISPLVKAFLQIIKENLLLL